MRRSEATSVLCPLHCARQTANYWETKPEFLIKLKILPKRVPTKFCKTNSTKRGKVNFFSMSICSAVNLWKQNKNDFKVEKIPYLSSIDRDIVVLFSLICMQSLLPNNFDAIFIHRYRVSQHSKHFFPGLTGHNLLLSQKDSLLTNFMLPKKSRRNSKAIAIEKAPAVKSWSVTTFKVQKNVWKKIFSCFKWHCYPSK